MEDIQQSPERFWYPTVVREIRGVIPGAQGNDQGVIEPPGSTVRYHFDFGADLADSLLTIDEAQVPNE